MWFGESSATFRAHLDSRSPATGTVSYCRYCPSLLQVSKAELCRLALEPAERSDLAKPTKKQALEQLFAACPGLRLQVLRGSRRPIPRVPPLAGLPPGWTQEQGNRELSAWFWRNSRDGISQLEVCQKLGLEGEDGPWQIWIQAGLLSRGPITRGKDHVVETFDTPLDAIAVADLLDENDLEGVKMAWCP